MNERQIVNNILHDHLDVNKNEDYTNYKKLITALINWKKEAINFTDSCERLSCENCGYNKQLKYCEKCYNTAFDTENQ